MTQDAKEQPVKQGKTILLFTGNIMMDGARAGFLNTSMGKNNAEVCHPCARGGWLTTACEFVATY